MTQRNQVEIDYCPSCRGVWLDRGELDKLLAYAETQLPVPHSGSRSENRDDDRYDTGSRYNGTDFESGHRPEKHQEQNYGHGQSRQYGHPKKKKSFLSDLFDFD